MGVGSCSRGKTARGPGRGGHRKSGGRRKREERSVGGVLFQRCETNAQDGGPNRG